jgi:type IV pilus assembly protein PilQ
MKALGLKLSVPIFIFILAAQISAFAQKDKAEVSSVSDNVTMDFKDADILNVLKIISYKAGVNIVAAPEVSGNITLRLTDVPWQTALDVILRTNGLAFEKQGSIITVAPIAKITEQKKQEVELAQVQPTATEVFNLKYIDAQDAKRALESQLSPRGKITILEMTGQGGWEFGGKELGKRRKEEKEKLSRSKVLIISDIPPALEEIRKVIAQIDVEPQQVLIETKIIEVSKDKLRDIGFDWGSGTDGATSTAVSTKTVSKNVLGDALEKVGGNILDSQVKPSIFSPKATSISGVYPYNLGLSLLFQKLSGFQFEALIHALEEDVGVNTLSAPRILALNNQEATILVGTRYPILKQDTVATTGSPVVNLTLDYYQDIGIQLNVIPQIGADNSINMVVHPAVTSYTNTLGTNVQYPILEIREAETRIFMKDGETIVIGGLLKDVKNKSVSGVPFLKDLPYLGKFFGRDTVDTEKIDLIVFITAHIVREESLTPKEAEDIHIKLGKGRTRDEAIIEAK